MYAKSWFRNPVSGWLMTVRFRALKNPTRAKIRIT
jgi:hypothetical protein